MKSKITSWLCAVVWLACASPVDVLAIDVGDTVKAAANTNVRTGPGTNYAEITDPEYSGTARAGTIGTVMAGPQSANGYTWWKVDFGPGLYSGWAVQDGLQATTPTVASVTLTLYVHEGSANGPVIPGVRVTGQDGAGNSFNEITDTDGFVYIVGKPGTWRFAAAKTTYQSNSWSQEITARCRRDAFLQPAPNPQQPTTRTLGSIDNPIKPANQNPGPSEVNAEIERLATEFGIPPIIIQAICWNEFKWKHFDEAGKPKEGTRQDFGLMQVREQEAARFRQYTDWKDSWRTNLRLGVQILLLKWSENGVPDPAGKLVLENWYFPIAWYNGDGPMAYNYVGKVYALICRPPTEIDQFCRVVDIGSPRRIPGWDVGTIKSRKGEVKSYELHQIVEAGGRIHRWNGKTGAGLAYEDITAQVVRNVPRPPGSGTMEPPKATVLSPAQKEVYTEKTQKLLRLFADPASFPQPRVSLVVRASKPALIEKSDNLYLAALDYQFLSLRCLRHAEDFLYKNDLAKTDSCIVRAQKYYNAAIVLRRDSQTVADGTYSVVETELEGVRNACETAVAFGLAVTNPTAAKVVDYIYTGVDYGVERAILGGDEARKNAAKRLLVKALFEEVKFPTLGNKTLDEYLQNRIGKEVFPVVDGLLRSEECKFAVLRIVKTAGVTVSEEVLLRAIPEGSPASSGQSPSTAIAPPAAAPAQTPPSTPSTPSPEATGPAGDPRKQESSVSEKPVAEAKPRQLAPQEQAQAASLWNKVEAARKLANNKGLIGAINKRTMVDNCRTIIRQFPDSEYASKAKQTLASLSARDRRRYGITDQEIGTQRK